MRGRCFPSGRRAFAELVPDSPGRYVQQPRLEGTPGRIVGELGQLARHGDDRFLHDVVGLRLGAAGLEGEAPNQVPITVIEFLPAGLVLTIPEPAQQAGARRQGAVWRGTGHAREATPSTRRREKIFQYFARLERFLASGAFNGK